MNFIKNIINSIKKLVNHNSFFDFIASGILIFTFGLLVIAFTSLLSKSISNRSPWNYPEKICIASHIEEYTVDVRVGHPRQNRWEKETRSRNICDQYSNNFFIKNNSQNQWYELVPRD